MLSRLVIPLPAVFFCVLTAFTFTFDQSRAADNRIVVAQSGASEKDAFEAAKDLGTIEAWEAFLEAYSTGFYADLARAYVKKLAGSDEQRAAPAAPAAADTPSPPAAPADISLVMTAQGACTGGQPCAVNITATNAGGEAYEGDLVLATSVAPGGATVSSASPQPWYCQDMGGGAVCTHPSLTLAPGQSTSVLIALNIPRNTGGEITSCSSISWGGAPTSSSARDVQQALNDAGFDAGRPDGRPGRKTRDAIRGYQGQAGLQITGEIDLPLLMALFTQPGEGDGDPANDQACAGSAVQSAVQYIPPSQGVPVGPSCPFGQFINAAGECACPASEPFWTGTSCIPLKRRGCRGGMYYDRRQKQCLCPTRRPFWSKGRCRSKPPAGPAIRQPGVAGCPTGTFLVGNVCLNANIAPVFANRRQGRGPGRGRQGQRQGTGVPLGAAVNQIINQLNKCSGGRVRIGGKCKCPGNQTFDGNICVPDRPGRVGGKKGGQTGLAGAGQDRRPVCKSTNNVDLAKCTCPPGTRATTPSGATGSIGRCEKIVLCPLNKVVTYACDTPPGKNVFCFAGAPVGGPGQICFVQGSAEHKAWIKQSQQRQAAQGASGGKACYPDPVSGKQVCNCPPSKVIRDPSTGVTWCGSVQDAQKAIQAAQAKLKNNGCPKAKPVKTLKGKCISYAQAKTTRCVDLGFPEAAAYHPTPSCAPSMPGGRTQKAGTQKCRSPFVEYPNGRCGCPSNLPRQVGNTCLAALPNLIDPTINQANRCIGGIRTNKGTCICPKNKPNLVNGICTGSGQQATQGASGAKACYVDVGTLKSNCNCPPSKVFTHTDGRKYCGTPQQLQNTQNLFKAGQEAAAAAKKSGCPPNKPWRKKGGGCVTSEQAKSLRCVDIGLPESAASLGGSCLPSRAVQGKAGQKAKPRKPAVNCQPPARGIGGKCFCPAGQRVVETGRTGDGKVTFVITYGCANAAPAPVQQKANTPKQLPVCSPGRLYQAGQCQCAPGWTYTRKPGASGFQCVKSGQAGQKKVADPFDCGDGRRKDNPTGRCLCPGGQSFVGGKCVRPQPANTRGQQPCQPGYARNPDNISVCLPIATIQALQRQKQQRQKQLQQQANQCVNNEIRLANGKCGCPANLPRHLERRCYPPYNPQPVQQQQQTGCPPNHQKIGNRCVLKAPKNLKAGCPSNMIRLNNGQCGCPNWAHLQNGQCVRKPSPTLREIKCAPNQIYNGQRCVTCGPNQVKQGNRCVNKVQRQVNCPPTHNKVGNNCVPKPKPQPAKCPNNQARLPNGQCGCGNWANLVNGVCVRKQTPTRQVQCPPGTRLQNGFCRPNAPPPKALKCGPNQVQRNNKCVNCPPNMAKQGNQCIPKRVNCGPNQVQRGNVCQNCPPNTTKQGNQCVQKPSQQQLLQKQLQLRQQLQRQRQQGPCPPGQTPGPNGGCVFSDMRLKRDIEYLATRNDGLNLYSFRYLWDETQYVGVMAQDLLADPAQADAVIVHESGYYMVDYTKLGLSMVPLAQWRAARTP